MVYKAGVKKGYSIYCPTCYADCGKHAVTDAGGNFTIGGLSPDLLFTLLVVREGYAATYVSKVDPAKGPAEKAVLKPRPLVPDNGVSSAAPLELAEKDSSECTARYHHRALRNLYGFWRAGAIR
jgi:hypothetical protein